MKNIIYILSAVMLTTFTACDYVDQPYPVTNANLGDTASCPLPSFPAVTVHTKKFLVEDFTGHTCPNCPRAARFLHDLDTTYPGRIIPLAIAVGSLAAPNPGFGGTPSTAFSADFRTTTGNELNAFFIDADGSGLPSGMINRRHYNAGDISSVNVFYNFWDDTIAAILSQAPDADLQMIANYDSATRKICCAVKTSFLNNLSGDYRLCVYLTQDSIVNWQDDIDGGPAPACYVSTYIHQHMLRDAITPTGTWGETIVTGGVAAGVSDTKRFAYNLPVQYNGIPCDENHCHLVAFIYNATTYEVIQSEEVRIIP